MQILENWDPLNLPRGSVRALLTLGILGVLWALMLQQRDVPLSLAYVSLMVLGHYFGFRGGDSPPGVRSPLYMPRGTIRGLIVAGFAAVAYFLWEDDRLRASVADRNFTLLLLVLGLVAGFLVRKVGDVIPGSKTWAARRWFENGKAIVALVATGVFVLACYLGVETPRHENLALLSAPIVVFYFGSRN